MTAGHRSGCHGPFPAIPGGLPRWPPARDAALLDLPLLQSIRARATWTCSFRRTERAPGHRGFPFHGCIRADHKITGEKRTGWALFGSRQESSSWPNSKMGFWSILDCALYQACFGRRVTILFERCRSTTVFLFRRNLHVRELNNSGLRVV